MNHQLDELADLAHVVAARRPEALARWLARQGDMYVHRIGADVGDAESQRRLAMWRARTGHTE